MADGFRRSVFLARRLDCIGKYRFERFTGFDDRRIGFLVCKCAPGRKYQGKKPCAPLCGRFPGRGHFRYFQRKYLREPLYGNAVGYDPATGRLVLLAGFALALALEGFCGDGRNPRPVRFGIFRHDLRGAGRHHFGTRLLSRIFLDGSRGVCHPFGDSLR